MNDDLNNLAIIKSVVDQTQQCESVVINIKDNDTGKIHRAIIYGVGKDFKTGAECIEAEMDTDD